MSSYTPAEWLGEGTITPSTPVPAGEYGSWTVEYTVGVAGVDDRARIRLAFRSATDWGIPQFDDPTAPNYVTLHSSVPVQLAPSWGRNGIRPWSKTLTVQINGGTLGKGDKLRVVLGDRSGGSPGMLAQTFPERDFHIKLQVDPFGTGVFETVADLKLPIIGGAATQLVLTAPTDVVAGESSWLQIRALDPWGNPDPNYRGTVRFSGDVPDGVPEFYTFSEADAGVHRFECRWNAPAGTLRVAATAVEQGFSTESNPIRCHADPPQRRYFWADLHGQTRETIGTGSVPEYFAYARDVAAVDATAHSANDFQITSELYEELRLNAESFYEPGRFVTFHGYEWSGNIPAGGDHNVYYLHDGPILRSSHALIDDRSDVDTDCYPIDRLYAAFAQRDDVIITPHIGGRRANLDYHDPRLEPAIEIASQWGRFEWFAYEALQRGMRVAFIAGSDDHSGRPGWSPATLAHHGTRGGLTAFIAEELTRESIWEAFKNRRCYGTSGPRIVVDVSVNGHVMGSEPVLYELPTMSVVVLGTAPIETIEVRRGTQTVYTHKVLPDAQPDDPYRIRLAWRGARDRGRTRPLNWAGSATVSGGRITNVENFAMDNPLDGVADWDEHHVSWNSYTCGDWDGVILDIDGDGNTQIAVDTPTIRLQFTLDELNRGPIRREGPYLEHQLVAQRLPLATAPHDVAFEWQDREPLAGVNPYWIWVTQTDGEFAWSTPVYAWWSRG